MMLAIVVGLIVLLVAIDLRELPKREKEHSRRPSF
jgi:hypothetical protein